MIAADEEQKGLFERNDEDVGMGFIYTDLEQPLEKLLGWSGEVSGGFLIFRCPSASDLSLIHI